MKELNERDIVILQSGVRALIIEILEHDQLVVFNTVLGKDERISSSDIKYVVRYEEIPAS